MSQNVNAVVVCEGPSVLEVIAGTPLLALWMDHLAEAGVQEVRLVGPSSLAEPLEQFAASRRTIREPRLQLGPGLETISESAAIAACDDLADGAEAVFVIRGANFSDVDLSRMLAFHRSHPQDLTAALFHETLGLGATFVELDREKRILRTTDERVPSDLAAADITLISSGLYREIVADRPPIPILDAYRIRSRGWPWVWYHRNINSPDALRQVHHDAPAILEEIRRKGRPAVFLDRDGTLIEEVNYLTDPGQVRVLPGVAQALRQLRAGGFARIVVTNQSAVGRGMLSVERLHEIHEVMHHQLCEQHAAVDAVYFCPDAPDPGASSNDDPTSRRKPGAGMLIAAAADLGLDLETSWMVGDQIGDLIAGNRAGCRGSILVQTGQTPPADPIADVPHRVAPDLLAASEIILSQGECEPRFRKTPVPA